MKILMIVPAYNEEANIVETIRRIEDYRMESEDEIDYIVINDGSTDLTESICNNNNIEHITLIENLGIGGAVQTGYLFAKMENYDIAIQFDGDGQHDVGSIDNLILPIKNGIADFVVGSRFIGGTSEFKSTKMRRVGIKYFTWLIKVMVGVKITDATSGFRAANKRAIMYLADQYSIDYPEPESIVDLVQNGFTVGECPVNMYERSSGKSSITPLRSVYFMIKVTVAMFCCKLNRGRL